MQPVFQYRQETYPPRGRIWPQFGDDILEETLSLSEGVRQSLNQKRDGMSDYHKENMQHHGLAPRADPPTYDMAGTDDIDPPMEPPDDYMRPAAPAAPQDPSFPQERLRRAPQPAEMGGLSRPGLPPAPPGSGMVPMTHFYGGGKSEPRVDVQGGLGKPPDFPGSGAAALRSRESFRATQPGPGGLDMSPDVEMLGGGGGPPQPPAAGAAMVPKVRGGPYDRKKNVSFSQDAPSPPPDPMDTTISVPAPIVAMEEQNTVPKRPREEEPVGKKKKPALAITQSPPSLPPPPPGGASVLRAQVMDDDDAQTVAYGDEEDDNQTVAYGDPEPEEIEDLPTVSAAAAPPRGDTVHEPLLPISGQAYDPEPEEVSAHPVEPIKKKGKSVLTPFGSSSSKGPQVAKQNIW